MNFEILCGTFAFSASLRWMFPKAIHRRDAEVAETYAEKN